uniref:Putative ATPase domain containing protein n=1 Tax=viral metagenome TaxID=1070528 RepID=A0A6M3M5R9_9ZZZZ
MNYLLIGKPGSGKTTAACTGKKPFFLVDVDGKAHEMENLQGLIKAGDLVIYTMKSRLIDDSLSYRALHPNKPIKIQPGGYVEVIDLFSRITDNDPEFKPFNTYILDSLTRLCEHLKRLLIYHRGQGVFGKVNLSKDTAKEVDANWPTWGSYLSNLEELFDVVTKYIPEGKDFICTAHEKQIVEKDPITEVEILKGIWPLVDGQMREKLAGMFNEVYFMLRRDVKGKPPDFQFRTAGNKYCARTSRIISEFIPATLKSI